VSKLRFEEEPDYDEEEEIIDEEIEDVDEEEEQDYDEEEDEYVEEENKSYKISNIEKTAKLRFAKDRQQKKLDLYLNFETKVILA
jgi:hypothetical protein